MGNNIDRNFCIIVIALCVLFLLFFGVFLEVSYPFPRYENTTRCTNLITNSWILGIPTCYDVNRLENCVSMGLVC